MSHLLDRPVWNALTTRQAPLALGDARVWRIDPAFGPFIACADSSPESLAAFGDLVRAHGPAAMIDADPTTIPAGLAVTERRPLMQMTAEGLTEREWDIDAVPLTEDDAVEMRALAHLTEPGPFMARTHQLGDFTGVKIEGRLAAMTGERMRVPGFTEVSAVCVHPDFRGRGYAAALTHMTAARIQARGETPFLHVRPDNTSAVAVYERLGFTPRRTLTLTIVAP